MAKPLLRVPSIIQTEVLPASSLAKLYSLQKAASEAVLISRKQDGKKLTQLEKLHSLECNSPSGSELLGKRQGRSVCISPFHSHAQVSPR